MSHEARVAGLFSGCGGLDLGFSQAGFSVVWANEYDATIAPTYERNHPSTKFDGRSILDVPSDDIPEVDGILGGPPCQSWSLAGAMRGLQDPRGTLFYEYVRVLRDKQPKFFVAENVKGMLSSSHRESFENIVEMFGQIGYDVQWRLLNARDHGVPQDRERVFIVGFRQDLGVQFKFPDRTHFSPKELETAKGRLPVGAKPFATLADAIGNLPEPRPSLERNQTNGVESKPYNHEYMTGGFSPRFLSRNRRRSWEEPSFTIQAGGRHAPVHPSSPAMCKVGVDEFIFDPTDQRPHRRLSVRECARIQTFPDDFVYVYGAITDAYKMIGNAVPVELARVVAVQVRDALCAAGSMQDTALCTQAASKE